MLTKDASTKTRELSSLLRHLAVQARDLRADLAHEPHADTLAQAIVCAAPILTAAPQSASTALPWLLDQLAGWEQRALNQASVLSTQYSVLSTCLNHLHTDQSPSLSPSPPLSHSRTLALPLSPAHLYEPFLHLYAKTTRKRHGVFFTPRPIADYIVTQIDQLLREQCNLPLGLAAHSASGHPLRGSTPHSALPLLLDPACGTGIFLLAVIDHVHRSFIQSHSAADWNSFVPDLLSRLIGIEILPAAAFLAKLNISLKLADTGYDFANHAKLNILTGDALSPAIQSQIPNPKSQIPVLLGNPPFSSLSTNTNPWISRLVRGDEEIRGYIKANGQQLGERKTWLHDDYVKFIRLAQWHVEEAGCGIVGFVTNHGYLDNATFRLMRHELLRVFSHIQILDLHGNRRGAGFQPAIPTRSASEGPTQARSASEGPTQARSASEGPGSPFAPDENIFGLDQGVAIGLFTRPPRGRESIAPTISHCEIAVAAIDSRPLLSGHSESLPHIQHVDLRGSRTSKLAALANSSFDLRPRAIIPRAPDWRFIPTPGASAHPEYASSWSLADAMPVNTTAPVTARDHFVVAFTTDELRVRIEEFRDLKISDERIRERYFTRTRSARYQTGDTRSWQLAEARRIVAADSDWQRHIIRCLYRPFDWRYVFWHPAMIDWPRNEVTQHIVEPECGMRNAECGVETSRSPARYSALRTPHSALCLLARRQQLPTQPCTFFWIADCLPLDGVIRSDNRGSESLFPLYINGTGCQANFAPAFVELAADATKLTWQPFGRADLAGAFGPEDLLAYIYALFHSPTYRERYADSLRTAFPRILPPTSGRQFVEMCRLGHELIDLHLMRQFDQVLSTQYLVPSTQCRSICSTPHSALRTPHLPPAVSSFRAGGYSALRKWLQPKHRSTADPEYAHIAAAIARTLEIMPAIDQAFTVS